MKLWRYGQAIERLGQRYRLDGVLGSGGMADVCLAWDEREECEVAIKVIKPDELNQRSLDRFLKEAASVARWRHPHILRIYGDVRLELLDVSQGSIVPYIVMEYARGGDLQKRLQPGVPYALVDTVHIFEQLCQAVSYAHSQGVIHRDLKPLNILFRMLPDQSEQVVLSDFGLAVEIAATHFTFAAGGTLPYMAPEQLRGRAEPASDIFALGVILYQLCTGRYPFRRTIQDLRQRGSLVPPPLPSSVYRLLPPDLDAVILRALNEDPAERFADALDFWKAVNAVVDADTLKAISRQQSLQHSSRSSSSPSYGASALPPASLKSNPTPILLRSAAESSPAPSGAQTRVLRGSAVPRTDVHQAPDQIEPPHSDPALADDRHTRATLSSQHPNIDGSSPDAQGMLSPDLAASAPAVYPQRAAHSQPGSRWLLVWPTSILLVVLLGSLFLARQQDMSTFLLPVTRSATITLIPVSRPVTNIYQFTAVTGTPDPAQSQIAGRQLLFTSQSQPQTVQGTGHMQIPGSAAKGTLTFLNGTFSPFTVTSSIPIPGPNGIQIFTDTSFTIPAASANAGKDGMITISAHAANVGAQGNISAMAINQACCSNTNAIIVKNTNAFTGGQDPKDYIFVQQGDVDGALNALHNTILQQARAGVQKQLPPSFELVGTDQCTDDRQFDRATVGDRGQNIPSTTVQLKVQCAQLAYDKDAAHQLALARLQQQANADPQVGPGYALVGNITTNVIAADAHQQGVDLQVQAQGLWSYTISAAQRQALARQVAGKSVAQARSMLMKQTGIANATVTLNGAQQDRLPENAAQIDVNVQGS